VLDVCGNLKNDTMVKDCIESHQRKANGVVNEDAPVGMNRAKPHQHASHAFHAHRFRRDFFSEASERNMVIEEQGSRMRMQESRLSDISIPLPWMSCSTASNFRILTRQKYWELTRLVGTHQSGSALLVKIPGRLHLALAGRRV
jgi:hypothetical protein